MYVTNFFSVASKINLNAFMGTQGSISQQQECCHMQHYITIASVRLVCSLICQRFVFPQASHRLEQRMLLKWLFKVF